jgi:hypothetical protein
MAIIRFDKVKWKTFDTLWALRSFATYWNETEAWIVASASEAESRGWPTWIPEGPEQEAEHAYERQQARHVQDEIISPSFRYSAVTLLFAITERELRRFIDTLIKDGGAKPISWKDLKGPFLQQVGKYCAAFHGIQLDKLNGYPRLHDLQKVRDCIVHCYGDVALSKDKDYLLKLNERRVGIFAYSGVQLDVEGEFIKTSIEDIWNFFCALFPAAGWELDDSWGGGPFR